MDNPRPQDGETQRDFLERAEAVLVKYAQTYCADMPQLIARMEELSIEYMNLDSADAYAELKRMAHDMKGQAAMFGLPNFATVADSLSLLLAKGNHSHPHYNSAVEFHVNVLKRLQAERTSSTVSEAGDLIDEAKKETDLVLKSD